MSDPDKPLDADPEWRARTDALVTARGRAIDAYAGVEHAMANLFSALVDIEQDLGTLIFYRIISARQRTLMMEDLIARRHGKTFDSYWKFLFSFINDLDTKRNQIIHWHTAGIREPALSHPKHFLWEEGGIPEVTIWRIEEFIERANFAAKAVGVFWLYADQSPTTWHEIFAQALPYPLPRTHPLSRWLPGHRIPPVPSQA